MRNQGIYSLNEAARYARVPAATIRSWFKVRTDGSGTGPLFQSDHFAADGDYAISFLNLIEVYVARFFRQEGVKPSTLRRAHEILQSELKTPHPFAHEDLCTDGRRIIRRLDDDSNLLDVISRQQFFGQMHLSRINYDHVSRLAQSWQIAKGVVINPRFGFGKPVIDHTGLTTYVVANQCRANGNDAALVAGLFGINKSDVFHAVEFEDGLRRHAA